MAESITFDPKAHLTRVNGGDYLEVKWRLAWLRQAHPDAEIFTEMVTHEDQLAVFRARVSVPDGGSATGWGSESMSDFRDYIEKAETKAVGRALAALGFGTQFCPDFEFGASAGKVVDSPIDFASTRGRRQVRAEEQAVGNISALNQAATPRQLKFIQAIAREVNLDESDLFEYVSSTYGRPVQELDRREASSLIEYLQSLRPSAPSDLAS